MRGSLTLRLFLLDGSDPFVDQEGQVVFLDALEPDVFRLDEDVGADGADPQTQGAGNADLFLKPPPLDEGYQLILEIAGSAVGAGVFALFALVAADENGPPEGRAGHFLHGGSITLLRRRPQALGMRPTR